MQTPSKVVEISPARGRDERSLKWIAMACVIVYLVSLGSIFGMAMMAVQASKEVHVDSESGALVGADTGQPVSVDPITDYQVDLSYGLPFLPVAHLANVASLEFQYVDANDVITPAAYQIHGVRKTAEGRATFLTAVGDTITVDGSNAAAFLESDGVSHMIIMDDGSSATDKDDRFNAQSVIPVGPRGSLDSSSASASSASASGSGSDSSSRSSASSSRSSASSSRAAADKGSLSKGKVGAKRSRRLRPFNCWHLTRHEVEKLQALSWKTLPGNLDKYFFDPREWTKLKSGKPACGNLKPDARFL